MLGRSRKVLGRSRKVKGGWTSGCAKPHPTAAVPSAEPPHRTAASCPSRSWSIGTGTGAGTGDEAGYPDMWSMGEADKGAHRSRRAFPRERLRQARLQLGAPPRRLAQRQRLRRAHRPRCLFAMAPPTDASHVNASQRWSWQATDAARGLMRWVLCGGGRGDMRGPEACT